MKKLLITAAISLAMTSCAFTSLNSTEVTMDCATEAVLSYNEKGYAIMLDGEVIDKLPKDFSRLEYGYTVVEELKVVILHKAVG